MGTRFGGERERERNLGFEGVNCAERGGLAHVSNVRWGCVVCRCRIGLGRVGLMRM